MLTEGYGFTLEEIISKSEDEIRELYASIFLNDKV